MDIILNDIRIAYTASGSGPPALLLHTWGADARSLEPLRQQMAGSCRAVSLDLPGCGESDPPPGAWGLEEYADFLEAFMEETCAPRPLLFGHGLGGRLAILLASRGKAGRLILCGVSCNPTDYGAGSPNRRGRRKQPGAAPADDRRNSVPDSDPARQYAAASGLNRELLVRTGSADLQPLLPGLGAEVLLIWGERDQAAPLEQAWLMAEQLPNAGLVLFPGCGHAPFAEQPSRFAAVTNYFISHRGAGA